MATPQTTDKAVAGMARDPLRGRPKSGRAWKQTQTARYFSWLYIFILSISAPLEFNFVFVIVELFIVVFDVEYYTHYTAFSLATGRYNYCLTCMDYFCHWPVSKTFVLVCLGAVGFVISSEVFLFTRTHLWPPWHDMARLVLSLWLDKEIKSPLIDACLHDDIDATVYIPPARRVPLNSECSSRVYIDIHVFDVLLVSEYLYAWYMSRDSF